MVDYTGGLNRAERLAARKDKAVPLISSGSDGRKRGRVSKFKKRMDKMVKLMRETQAAEAAAAAEKARLFKLEHPHQVVLNTHFQEKEFGDISLPDTAHYKKQTQWLSSIVVSLALFDGSMMLFACSGLAIPSGTTKLELRRFVTSRRLVEEFNKNRNTDDKLRLMCAFQIIRIWMGSWDYMIKILLLSRPVTSRIVSPRMMSVL